MTSRSTCCPVCGYRLVDRRRAELTLKASIIKLRDDGEVVARCPQPRCSGEVSVDGLRWRGDPKPHPARIRRRLVVTPMVDGERKP